MHSLNLESIMIFSPKVIFAEWTARIKSEQNTASNFLSLVCSINSFDCLIPNSEMSTSPHPEEMCFSLSVVVPWTKYVIFTMKYN